MRSAGEWQLIEAIELIGRCGASEFEVGYLVDDPPPGTANWYASAKFRKGTLVTEPRMTPGDAAETLASILRKDAKCAWCGRPISWGDRPARGAKVCWWRKIGGRWERGCPRRDEPLVKERAVIPTSAHTPEAMAYWADHNPRPAVFTAPDDPPNCEPCPALITDSIDEGYSGPIVRVAWKPDEIELAHLARGGTIWLSCWGGLPAHMLEVQAP